MPAHAKRNSAKPSAHPEGSFTRTAFGVAAVAAILLNALVVVLAPYWPQAEVPKQTCASTTSSLVLHSPPIVSEVSLKPARTAPAFRKMQTVLQSPPSSIAVASPTLVDMSDDVTEILEAPSGPGEVVSWEGIRSPLQPLKPSALRLIPDARSEAAARRDPCWLTFGLSSIHRSKAEYLGLTLSHLFDALAGSIDTSIVVHLADFDENWVTRTARWLANGFADEVEAIRFHAIHAPQHLYPLKVVAIRSLEIQGFPTSSINGLYLKRASTTLNGREVYLTVSGTHFLYWCQSSSSQIFRRRWLIAPMSEYGKAQGGTCVACARAPKDREAVDPLVRGWEEVSVNSQGEWLHIIEAGVTRIELEEGETLKYGDGPERQRWRSKQNLDYAFLMWYAAGLSEFYMQLEDDIQVVPGFLPTVRSYIQTRLMGNPWVMVAFSKLGFIGKLLNSSNLQSLGQFLFSFNEEAPCDWLVWVWIDILSPEPVTSEIIIDLEREYDLRQNRKANPGFKLPKSMRDDIALFYRSSPQEWFDSQVTAVQVLKPMSGLKRSCTVVHGEDLQGAELHVLVVADADGCKQKCEVDSSCGGYAFDSSRGNTCWLKGSPPFATVPNSMSMISGLCQIVSSHHGGRSSLSLLPLARVKSTMDQYQQYSPASVYPPHDDSWFWTKDTCWDRTENAPPDAPPVCAPESKYLDVIFEQPLMIKAVNVQMGVPGHESDYIRRGSLRYAAAGDFQSGCDDFQELVSVTEPTVSWRSATSLQIRCLRVVLTAPQKEWVTINSVNVEQALASAGTATAALPAAPVRQISGISDVVTSTTTASSLVSTAKLLDAGGNKLPSLSAEDVDSEEPSDASYNALLAGCIGICAGIAGWISVSIGRKYCISGVQTVGEFTCWSTSFLFFLDVMLFAVLTSPGSPPVLRTPGASVVSCEIARVLQETQLLSTTTTTTTTTSSTTLTTSTMPQQVRSLSVQRSPELLVVDKRWLHPGIRRLDTSKLIVPGLWEKSAIALKWLVVALVVDAAVKTPTVVTHIADNLVKAGEGKVVVLLHVVGTEPLREAIYLMLRNLMADAVKQGLLRVISAPESLYPRPLVRRENFDYAYSLIAAASLSSFYMQVEPDCSPKFGFFDSVQNYMAQLQANGVLEGMLQSTSTWHAVVVSKQGYQRKIIRSAYASRLAELLVMFPHIPADVLIWDFMDIKGNQTGPKSCKIALDASKRLRPDVILQYHKAEVLIEHVGDSSSLQGKVQRIREDYFKSHQLANTLFDNPPAHLRSNLNSESVTALQQIYGLSSTGFQAIAANTYWQTSATRSPPTDAFLEVVFKSPTNLEIFNLRMGGHLPPAKKGQQAEVPNLEFDYVLDDAELHFGRELLPQNSNSLERPACRSYEHVDHISGRELFWRSPRSRPAQGVVCVKVSVANPQRTPLIIRGISARSGRSQTRRVDEQPVIYTSRAPARTTLMLMTTTTTTTSDLGESPRHFQARLDRWTERHFAWSLTVSLAFVSGALAGVLGYVIARLRGAGLDLTIVSPASAPRGRHRKQ